MAYESDELADNSDDKKRLFIAEKEAEKRLEKRKRKQNPAIGARKRVAEASGPEVPAGRGGIMRSRLPPTRPRLIGPCYRCGEFRHLITPRPVYPFDQPLVSEAVDSVACLWGISVNMEGGPSNVKSLREFCKLTILGNAPSPDHGVDNDQTECHMPMADQTGTKILKDTLEALDRHKLCRCPWEWEGSKPNLQITDIQGRLKQACTFWRDTLQAPSSVLDWIRTGYRLPLLCAPTPYCQGNHQSAVRHAEFVSESIGELVTNCCVTKVIHLQRTVGSGKFQR